MLSQARVQTTLPAADLERARRFYAEQLGLEPAEETPGGLRYELAGGAGFFIFPTSIADRGGHTQAAFEVADIDAAAAELRSRGVSFEEYDTPELKTVDGITDMPDGFRGGWFKDSEGNLLGIFQAG